MIKKCKFCDKEIETIDKNQLDYLMLQHLISKHKDKIEIKEREKPKK